MTAVIIIFMIIATIFAIASLAYIIVDIILEKRKKDKEEPEEEPEEELPAEVPVVVNTPSEPLPEAEEAEEEFPVLLPFAVPHEPLPEIVGHIDAEEADVMISDDIAMDNANYEEGAGQGRQEIINIGTIDVNFNANDIVTLEALKQKGLISKNAERLKILADGILTKPLTVKSESYSVQAIKMIELTGGTVIILKD